MASIDDDHDAGGGAGGGGDGADAGAYACADCTFILSLVFSNTDMPQKRPLTYLEPNLPRVILRKVPVKMDKQMTLIRAGFPDTTINHTESQQELIDHRHERDEPDMKLKHTSHPTCPVKTASDHINA